MAGLGHFGFGFAAKRFAPRVPLALLLIASEAIDLVYIVLVIVGVDRTSAGAWTHSLVMAVVWSTLCAKKKCLRCGKQGSRVKVEYPKAQCDKDAGGGN